VYLKSRKLPDDQTTLLTSPLRLVLRQVRLSRPPFQVAIEGELGSVQRALPPAGVRIHDGTLMDATQVQSRVGVALTHDGHGRALDIAEEDSRVVLLQGWDLVDLYDDFAVLAALDPLSGPGIVRQERGAEATRGECGCSAGADEECSTGWIDGQVLIAHEESVPRGA